MVRASSADSGPPVCRALAMLELAEPLDELAEPLVAESTP
jgi:hypothetical protein